MSVINRTLVLNPVEPAPVSMKLRTGLDQKIEFEYLRQNGAPYSTDFAAQLYLIERSTKKVLRYALPSTDPINGKARAFIPAGDLKDPNGYNVQVIGTVEGEPRLIARGSASVYETEALGIIPADIVDMLDLTFAYNQPASFDVNMWQDTAKTSEYSIASTVITAYIYSQMGGPVLVPFTTEVLDNNTARLSLTVEQVNNLPPDCWWGLLASTGTGTTMLAQGDVLITGTPLPPFSSATIEFNYVKQDSLAWPGTGDCIQSNFAMDILRFSIYDTSNAETLTSLNRIVPGDTITVGTTVWEVVSRDAQVPAGFTQFLVTPAVQEPLDGPLQFTFTKV